MRVCVRACVVCVCIVYVCVGGGGRLHIDKTDKKTRQNKETTGQDMMKTRRDRTGAECRRTKEETYTLKPRAKGKERGKNYNPPKKRQDANKTKMKKVETRQQTHIQNKIHSIKGNYEEGK